MLGNAGVARGVNLNMLREGAFSVSWFVWFFTFPIQESMFEGEFASLVTPLRLLSLAVIVVCEATRARTYRPRSWVQVALLALLAVSALRADNTILLQGAILVFCSRNYDARHLLSTAASALLLSTIVVVSTSACGLIESGDWMASDGRGLRRSFGFVYPSRLPNYYLSFVLILMLTRRRLHGIALMILGTVACFLLITTGSRNPFLFTIVSLLLYPLIGSNRMAMHIKKHRLAISLLPVACVVGLFALTIAYDPSKPWMEFFDRLLSGRLHLSQTAINNNAITLFGSPAFGQIAFANAKTGYFDSSIFRLIYFFGLIPAIIFVCTLVKMFLRCASNGESRLLFVAVIALFHGLVEGQLILLQYSPFLIGMSRPDTPFMEASDGERRSGKSRLIVAQTPFQMLAAAAFLEKCPDGARNDLLILNKYDELRLYLPVLKQVSRLYIARQDKPYPSKPLFWLIVRELLFPTSCKRELEHSCPEVCKAEKYDELVFSSATPLIHNLRKYVCEQDVRAQLIDDGMGSHAGSLYASISFMDDIVAKEAWNQGNISKLKYLIKRALSVWTDARLKFGVETLWLFNPGKHERERYSDQVVIRTLELPTCQLPGDASAKMEESIQGYEGKRIVVLLGPSDQPEYVNKAEATILSMLKGEDIVIRCHPRSDASDDNGSGGTYIDRGVEPWEVMLAHHLIEGDVLLIGFFSTAQWMPKLLMDLEPSLMFLSEMTGIKGSVSSINREMIEEIRESYRDKRKIHLPSNWGDVENILKSFKKKKGAE